MVLIFAILDGFLEMQVYFMLQFLKIIEELALEQKQRDLLGHTCSPRLSGSVRLCKIDVVLPEAVNSLIIHLFHSL